MIDDKTHENDRPPNGAKRNPGHSSLTPNPPSLIPNPWSLRPEIFADPYPVAHYLRATDPAHWSQDLNAWVLTRYGDVAELLHDPRFAADRLPPLDSLAETGLERLRPLFSALSKMLIFVDPPDHTRLRGLVSRAFTPRIVEGWRVGVQQLVDGILDRVEPESKMDIIGDLAQPLPLTVIGMVLGVPPEYHAQFKRWSDDISFFIGNFSHTDEQLATAQRSILDFSDYFRSLIEARRGNPEADLLSTLIAARDRDDALSEEELQANCMFLLAAGHITTTNLIGNGTLALLRNREQATRMIREPACLESAVEELLRYDSPVQMTARLAKEDVEIGGKLIGKGQKVILWLGAANRDPERFHDPDRLDLGRTNNQHLAFSNGARFCLGAPLARLQGQVVISTLFRRFPGIRLQGETLHWQGNHVIHGLISLPVTLGVRG